MEYLYKAGLMQEVIQRFASFVSSAYDKTAAHMLEANQKSYEVTFISGGLFFLLLHWIERGLIETPEEMAKMAMRLLQVSSEPLLQ